MNRLTLSLVIGLAGLAVVASPAAASCIPFTPAQQRARAAVIFDGVALEEPTPTGIQRFHVTRYLKGAGPAVVRVGTGFVRRTGGGVSITSVSLVVHRREHWRIYGRGDARRVIQSNACDGSRKR